MVKLTRAIRRNSYLLYPFVFKFKVRNQLLLPTKSWSTRIMARFQKL